MSIEGLAEETGEFIGESMGEYQVALGSIHQHVEPAVPFVESAHTLAVLAGQAYNPQPISTCGYTVQEYGPLTPDGLSSYVVFHHQSSNRRVFALRGSESPRDWIFDAIHIAPPIVSMFLGITGGGSCFVIDMYAALTSVVRTFNRFTNISAVVGHSLGGYFASLLCSHSGHPGMAFQAPGTPPRMRGNNIHPNFRVINVANDLIGNASNNFGRGHGHYPVYYFPLRGSPRELHSIGSLIEFSRGTRDTNASVVTVDRYV